MKIVVDYPGFELRLEDDGTFKVIVKDGEETLGPDEARGVAFAILEALGESRA